MTIAAFTDLSGCELCLVPDAGIGLSGSNLITWSDQSGLARHASVATAVADGFATATGPIYSANDAAFAGKPSITWGSPNTSCLAIASFTNIPAPCTFILAGHETSGQTAISRLAFDRLASKGAANGTRWQITASTPFDSFAPLWGPSSPVGSAGRRIVSANMRISFVAACVYRSSTFGIVVHNGIVRANRTMAATATPPAFGGLRLGRSFGNAVDGQEWTGPLSLFVLYSRELSFSELKDVTLLAGSKCGITWPAGRLAA